MNAWVVPLSSPLLRGKLLGGSSALNLMAWGRASTDEYEAVAQFAEDSSWSFSGLLQYFKKSESLSVFPANPYPNVSLAQTSQMLLDLPNVDGFDGPIIVCGIFSSCLDALIIKQASHNSYYLDVVNTMATTMNNAGIATNVEPVSQLQPFVVTHIVTKPFIS